MFESSPLVDPVHLFVSDTKLKVWTLISAKDLYTTLCICYDSALDGYDNAKLRRLKKIIIPIHKLTLSGVQKWQNECSTPMR